MTTIDKNVSDELIYDKYSIESSINEIFELYESLIQRSINQNIIEKEQTKIRASIKQNNDEYKIHIHQNGMGISKEEFINIIDSIDDGSHPTWLYAPFSIVEDSYKLVSNSPESQEFFISEIKKEYINFSNVRESSTNDYGTEIQIRTYEPENIVNFGSKLRSRISQMDQISERKYVMKTESNKIVKKW